MKPNTNKLRQYCSRCGYRNMIHKEGQACTHCKSNTTQGQEVRLTKTGKPRKAYGTGRVGIWDQ